ncbi:SelT/SelW/SelH family protein [Flammeovirga sp. EKP202]|uniref:SelT/SelW/SelH family protein n=1 Tax=Flammeovirga sp. EKP202 TaxID=2770592 RepID=UPI00165F4561|nr:SelT/SelW/SelH family protein [Flammeovirga sp. EKP202]MBD0400360.1 SelT/SelW/SelH family protein [Flammeovirga sp. EKP202]
MEKIKITIEYCTLCQWTPRAVWLQQELLYTFNNEIEEISLRPTNGGVFKIYVNEQQVWDRKEQGFPEPKKVKQTIRNLIDPERSLGHTDK